MIVLMKLLPEPQILDLIRQGFWIRAMLFCKVSTFRLNSEVFTRQYCRFILINGTDDGDNDDNWDIMKGKVRELN